MEYQLRRLLSNNHLVLARPICWLPRVDAQPCPSRIPCSSKTKGCPARSQAPSWASSRSAKRHPEGRIRHEEVAWDSAEGSLHLRATAIARMHKLVGQSVLQRRTLAAITHRLLPTVSCCSPWRRAAALPSSILSPATALQHLTYERWMRLFDYVIPGHMSRQRIALTKPAGAFMGSRTLAWFSALSVSMPASTCWAPPQR
jgi:hypothetical protein